MEKLQANLRRLATEGRPEENGKARELLVNSRNARDVLQEWYVRVWQSGRAGCEDCFKLLEEVVVE